MIRDGWKQIVSAVLTACRLSANTEDEKNLIDEFLDTLDHQKVER